jgi:hypothetical protein
MLHTFMVSIDFCGVTEKLLLLDKDIKVGNCLGHSQGSGQYPYHRQKVVKAAANIHIEGIAEQTTGHILLVRP